MKIEAIVPTGGQKLRDFGFSFTADRFVFGKRENEVNEISKAPLIAFYSSFFFFSPTNKFETTLNK